MRGICFESIERVGVGHVTDPEIEASTDAIVRVELAGLCGSDLHPYYGRERGIESGTVMGHEFVGEVIAVGDAVEHFRVGDRVCAPFTTNCGNCFYCQIGLTARCPAGEQFGWIEGGAGLHGAQAEKVRVPLADGTLVSVPEGISTEVALLLGDNLSTAFFAVENLGTIDRRTVAVVGCGTVGLLTLVVAKWLGLTDLVAIDPNPARRDQAKSLGVDAFADERSALKEVRDRTDGRGADAVIELVGLPEAQRTAYELIRPGGVMSVIGCHCTPNFAFSPADAYGKNLTYRTGRCSARAFMEPLAQRFLADPLDLSWVFTHRFSIDQGVRAYDVFANREDGCVKAALQF